MEVHLPDLKDYDHCLVYADKGEAASLCSSIESECLEEIMMAGSGEPSTDHIRNNYSLVNSNSGLTMYKGELSIQVGGLLIMHISYKHGTSGPHI